MDVGLRMQTIADHIGSRIRIRTTDGIAEGCLTCFCPQSGQHVLSMCILDGEFVGEMTIPDRDIIPNDDKSMYYVIEDANKKKNASLKSLENKNKKKSRITCLPGLQEDEKVESLKSEKAPALEKTAGEADDFDEEAYRKEFQLEYEKSKQPRKYLSAETRDEAVVNEAASDVEDIVLQEEEVEEWADACDLPFDAEVLLIRSVNDLIFPEAIEIIKSNNRIGLAAFGKEINRFHPLDFLSISCTSQEGVNYVFVFMLKKAGSEEVDKEMTAALSQLLQSNTNQIKAMHDCCSMSDVMKWRFNVTWLGDEVEDSMCYDIELRAEMREHYIWKTGRKWSTPAPKARVRLEELLIDYLDMKFGADCFPNYLKADEYRCVLSHKDGILTSEAVNFVKRKTLFLPHLMDVIVQHAEQHGHELKELSELIQTRLELRRESADGAIDQFQMDERYDVRMGGMYVNPHSMRRRDIQAIEQIAEAAKAKPVRRITIEDLNWIDNRLLPPVYRWYPMTDSSCSSSHSSQTSDNNNSSISASDEKNNWGGWGSSECDAASGSAPAGHAHLLNDRRRDGVSLI